MIHAYESLTCGDFDIHTLTSRCAYIRTYVHTYIRSYIHTYMHTYIRSCIHTYIHTYTHIHAHTNTFIHSLTHSYVHFHTRINCFSYLSCSVISHHEEKNKKKNEPLGQNTYFRAECKTVTYLMNSLNHRY